jgi:hypothetical protein
MPPDHNRRGAQAHARRPTIRHNPIRLLPFGQKHAPAVQRHALLQDNGMSQILAVDYIGSHFVLSVLPFRIMEMQQLDMVVHKEPLLVTEFRPLPKNIAQFQTRFPEVEQFFFSVPSILLTHSFPLPWFRRARLK